MQHRYFSARQDQISISSGTETLTQKDPLPRASRRLWLSGFAAVILAAAAINFAPPAAHAGTTIVVTTTADETVADGNCSLEEAIQAANTDTAVDACPAGSGADTIVLAAGATYTLTTVDNNGEGPNGVPFVTSPITINGNGATITRSSASGTPQFRLTDIVTGGSVTLNDLTVSNFDEPAGAGINGVQGLGGAILAHGDLTINDSTISGNRAEFSETTDADGGAIWAGGTLTVTNSTISGNAAAGRGGSVGGGIIVRPGAVATITSSTFADNSAQQGNDLETESSGLTITDTIMASGCLLEATITDGGHNLETGSSCGFSSGTDLRNTNPQLGALASNGGPTPTQALAPGSPAVDAGGTCPAADGGTDQRGLPRFTPCDIGAYEVQDQAPVITANSGFTSTEGTSFTGAVATVADGDSPAGGDLAATISWGDGSQSAGTLVPVSGQPTNFTINGTHTYQDEGNFTQTITVNDSDSGTFSTTSTVSVADAPLSGSGGFTLRGTEGPTSLLGGGTDMAPVSGTVATFTDANPAATTADFTATISWGDGSTSTGTVSGPAGGPFSVAGSHSYAEDGTYTIGVTIADDGGSQATATSAASIADPPGLLQVLDITEDLLGG